MRAIILAGGRGERLMPFTADRPKSMVDVAGEPIIAHQLRWLGRQGVDRVMVSCGYRWQCIREFIGEGARFGLDVRYAAEEAPLGRGGGLRYAWDRFGQGNDPIIALNGDVLTSLSLRPMVRRHARSEALATLLLVPYRSQHGIVEIGEDQRVTAFREKPKLPYWLSGGVYVLSPATLPRLPRHGDHETFTWPRLAAAGLIAGYQFTGFWCSLDGPKDVARADQLLMRRNFQRIFPKWPAR